MTTDEIIASIDEEIERLKHVKSLLTVDVVSAPRGPGRPKGRTLSAEARKKIAAAQRRRWAKEKGRV